MIIEVNLRSVCIDDVMEVVNFNGITSTYVLYLWLGWLEISCSIRETTPRVSSSSECVTAAVMSCCDNCVCGYYESCISGQCAYNCPHPLGLQQPSLCCRVGSKPTKYKKYFNDDVLHVANHSQSESSRRNAKICFNDNLIGFLLSSSAPLW